MLTQFRALYPNDQLTWINENQVIEGVIWRGCLESIDLQLHTGKYLPSEKDLQDSILFFLRHQRKSQLLIMYTEY